MSVCSAAARSVQASVVPPTREAVFVWHGHLARVFDKRDGSVAKLKEVTAPIKINCDGSERNDGSPERAVVPTTGAGGLANSFTSASAVVSGLLSGLRENRSDAGTTKTGP